MKWWYSNVAAALSPATVIRADSVILQLKAGKCRYQLLLSSEESLDLETKLW